MLRVISWIYLIRSRVALFKEGTPTVASFNTDSLQPLHRYSWQVAGVNSIGTGTFTDIRKFLIGPSMECWPEIGTGNGYDDIETCYDLGSSTDSYLLKDISRRANMNIDGHNGHMTDSNSILTQSVYVFNSITNVLNTRTSSDNNWGDPANKSGVDAHNNTAKVYDYFNSKFYLPPPNISLMRDNILQESMVNIVEWQDINDCPNAWWDNADPTPTIYYCKEFAFSSSLGIVGHEWAHAVTGRVSDRGYNVATGRNGEGGAITEAFSDWMAAAIKQAQPSGPTIYENIWMIAASGESRDLSNPLNSVPAQPVWYGGVNWINTFNCTPTLWRPPDGNDSCGVHINTGVPNKMFYLLSMGGEGVQAIGIDNAIKIAFKANINKWKTTPTPLTFRDARQGMIYAAQDLFGYLSNEVTQVDKAWAAVGVTATSTPEMPFCFPGL